MKEPTPLVFYLPEEAVVRDASGKVDVADLLARIGAIKVSPGPTGRSEAYWAELWINGLVEEWGGRVRFIIEVSNLEMIEMMEIDDNHHLRLPGRLPLLINEFAEAADVLGASIAFARRRALAEDDVFWAGRVNEFDQILELDSVIELLRFDAAFGWARDRDDLEWRYDPPVHFVWGVTYGFRTENGTLWQGDQCPPVAPRPGPDEPVFDVDVARSWPEKWWGFWHHTHYQRTGRLDTEDHIDDYTDDSADFYVRRMLVEYLEASPACLAAQESLLEPALCVWCEAIVPEFLFQSDGVWLWPGLLAHQVEEHDFVLPNAMASHILRRSGIPLDEDEFVALGIKLDDLPWPDPLPGDGPWPHQTQPGSGWRLFRPDGTIVEPDGSVTKRLDPEPPAPHG